MRRGLELRTSLRAMLDPAIVPAYASSAARIARRALRGQRRHPGDARSIARACVEASWSGDHFVASGGHFRQFWTRDTGFSAEPLVRTGFGPRLHASLGWALDAWAVDGRVTTTIFPGRRPRDVYTLGIDSLPLLLHALRACEGDDLVARHAGWLAPEIRRYAAAVLDPATGLVRTDRRFSSHRDTVVTASNGYANTMVVLLDRILSETGWFTSPVPPGAQERFLATFWAGDRMLEAPDRPEVTGDATVFPFWLGTVPDEPYLAPALAAARAAGLATPLPLRYAAQPAPEDEDPVQHLFVPDYQGTAIWTSLGAIYLQLLERVDPAAVAEPLAAYAALVEREGTVWEVLDDDLRPYVGRFGLFRADEAMLWSAILLDLARAAGRGLDGQGSQPERARSGHDHDRRDQAEQQVSPPRRDRQAREHGHPLDPDVEGRRAGIVHDDHHIDGGERREDRRTHELEVVEGEARQAIESRRQEPDGARRIGDREHQDGQQDEVGAHDGGDPAMGGSGGSWSGAGRSRSNRPPGIAYRSADAGVPSGAVSRAMAGGTSSPTAGPTSPPAMIPIDGLDSNATITPTPAPTIAATSSRRPVMSPTARPIMAAGKMMSIPNRAGSGIEPPAYTPASVARFHGMKVAAIPAIQYPRVSGHASRRKWPIDNANDSSVTRWAMTARRGVVTFASHGPSAAE